MLPALADLPVLETQAGVRVSVPGIRLPVLDRLPGSRRIWVFGGLGSKGLLMAPLLARDLADYLAMPETIPSELRLRMQ